MSLTGPPAPDNPFVLLGGEDVIRRLAEAFYDSMELHEPELAQLHPLDGNGRVDNKARYRFGLFLMGWLGGPQDYISTYGHPRLRMRHAKVPVTFDMAGAWVRSMDRALDEVGVEGPVRTFLDRRFAEVATFLINVDPEGAER